MVQPKLKQSRAGGKLGWELAVSRQSELRQLSALKSMTRADVEAAALRLGVHASTVYRLLRRFSGPETVAAIVGKASGWQVGNSRLDPKTEALIESAIERFFLTREMPGELALTREVARLCRNAGLAAPSRPAIRRRLAKITKKELLGKRHGRDKAESVTMRPGKLVVTKSNAMWQIDHSPADIIIVDAIDRRPIGRPWLTFVIDIASRVIVGVHVSLEAPSVVSVGMALRHAILPKSEAMRERGIDADWPAFGLPDAIHTDNGSDFRSQVFVRACANFGIETIYRPPGTPRYGGHIERLIGTAQRDLHLLPGTTFSNVATRGSYDSDERAVMTLDELETWLWRYIACDYNVRVHSSTGMAPLALWRREIGRTNCTPRQPGDPEALAFEFLPSILRSIGRQGIVLNHIHYYEPFLETLFDMGAPKVRVHYDPRDMSRVHVATAHSYQTVRYRNLANPPLSLSEIKAARRRLQDEGNALVNERAIFEARDFNRELVARSVDLTRRQRRDAERTDRGFQQAVRPILVLAYDSEVDGAASVGQHDLGEIEQW